MIDIDHGYRVNGYLPRLHAKGRKDYIKKEYEGEPGPLKFIAQEINNNEVKKEIFADLRGVPAEEKKADKKGEVVKAKATSLRAKANPDGGVSLNKEAVLDGKKTMMKLADYDEFSVCQSTYVHGDYLNIEVDAGCISLFNNDLTKQSLSNMITFCGCEQVGPKKYDFVSLQNAGLISKSGAALVSFIAVGEGASVSVFDGPNFDGENSMVFGALTERSLKRVIRFESTWDNSIYSLILQSWISCEKEVAECKPVTTQEPVTSPTKSPFINPTPVPTGAPIISPSSEPTLDPTPEPTLHPRARPTMSPLAAPTLFPTRDPTKAPLPDPSQEPTLAPLAEPSYHPTNSPLYMQPTFMPTVAPTMDKRIVMCKGKSAKESNIIPGETYPHNGCISFFWKDVEELAGEDTMVSTLCTCGEVGHMSVPNDIMSKIGATRGDGFPTVSTIITGYNTSLTLYSTDDLSGTDKFVVGPHDTVDLSHVKRKSGPSWDDSVRSVGVMAWNECIQHLYEDSCVDF